jgi:hypothetical protein
MDTNTGEKKPKVTAAPKHGSEGLKEIIIEAIAEAYCTTPAMVGNDLQESEGDFALAELCDALAECGY